MHYIFAVRIIDPNYSAEDYAEAWLRASAFIQRAPGAQGTRLHRKIGDPRTLLAIATWDSKASRDAMEREPAQEVAAIIAVQMPHVEIELIGEFDAPEWVVLPDSLF
ncbi:MAG: antibiotic biosynthesis monooxygenase [Congregibacter sp.]